MEITKYITVVLLATIKTMFSPPVAYGMGMNYLQCFLTVSAGGILGFVVFFAIWDYMIKLTNRVTSEKNKAKRFRRARRIVTMKHKYKLGVFLFLLPFLSVPVMAYVVRKFYGHDQKIYIVSLFIIVVWAAGESLMFAPMLLL